MQGWAAGHRLEEEDTGSEPEVTLGGSDSAGVLDRCSSLILLGASQLMERTHSFGADLGASRCSTMDVVRIPSHSPLKFPPPSLNPSSVRRDAFGVGSCGSWAACSSASSSRGSTIRLLLPSFSTHRPSTFLPSSPNRSCRRQFDERQTRGTRARKCPVDMSTDNATTLPPDLSPVVRQ